MLRDACVAVGRATRLPICSSAPELRTWVLGACENIHRQVCGKFGARVIVIPTLTFSSNMPPGLINPALPMPCPRRRDPGLTDSLVTADTSHRLSQHLPPLRCSHCGRWNDTCGSTYCPKPVQAKDIDLRFGKRYLDRKFIRSCKSISICQDKRNTRGIISDAHMPSVIARGCWPQRRQ
jgi:hypothetical protein